MYFLYEFSFSSFSSFFFHAVTVVVRCRRRRGGSGGGARFVLEHRRTDLTEFGYSINSIENHWAEAVGDGIPHTHTHTRAREQTQNSSNNSMLTTVDSIRLYYELHRHSCGMELVEFANGTFRPCFDQLDQLELAEQLLLNSGSHGKRE